MGTASGINNAVSRVAGVLAIAVLGAVMIVIFGEQLSHHLSDMALRADLRNALQSNATEIGALSPPPNVDSPTGDKIHAAVGAGKATFTTVPSIKAMLEARMVARSTHCPEPSRHGVDAARKRIKASSQGGFMAY